MKIKRITFGDKFRNEILLADSLAFAEHIMHIRPHVYDVTIRAADEAQFLAAIRLDPHVLTIQDAEVEIHA